MKLYSQDLYHKNGFEDGDILDNVLDDNGFDSTDIVGDEEHFDESQYLCHEVLQLVVRRHLLPALARQDLEVQDNCSYAHNPIRALSVGGVEIDCHDLAKNPILTPEFVEVDEKTILDIAREVMEKRTEARRLTPP